MTTELTIYGASDDLLEIRGDIKAEAYPPREYRILLTDGTLIKAEYARGWRFNVEETGQHTAYEKYSAGSEKAEKLAGRDGTDVLKIFSSTLIHKIFVIDDVKEVITDENK